MRSSQKALRTLFGIEFNECACIDHLATKAVVLILRSVAKINGIRLAQLGHVGNPTLHFNVLNVLWNSVICHILGNKVLDQFYPC